LGITGIMSIGKNDLDFLTEKNCSNEFINDILDTIQKDYKGIYNEEDEKILKDFKSTNLGLFLTPHEITYLNLNDKAQWADYLLFRWKFRCYPSLKKLLKVPLYLLIEPVSICNMRCIMCFQRDETFSSNKDYMGMMNMDLFKHIIDEAYENGIKAVTLASRGEPTLHPRFGEMLAYTTGKFFEVKLSTNALLLNDEKIYQILESDVSFVTFSCDAFTQEGYRKIRLKDKFNTVLSNIENFNRIKTEEYPDSKCMTRVHGVKVDKGLDYNAFHDFWKNKCDTVTLMNCQSRWDTYNNPIIGDEEKKISCYRLWKFMYIWYDGTCNPCDLDYKSFLSVGSVVDKSISEIWRGEKFEKLRKSHINGQCDLHYPCDRCYL